MMPRDTNAHGTVFGGIIMSYIDVAGGVEAVRHTRHDRFVTVAMKEVIFHEPVFIGDLVSFYAETRRVGNTSITVHVEVEAERRPTSNLLRESGPVELDRQGQAYLKYTSAQSSLSSELCSIST